MERIATVRQLVTAFVLILIIGTVGYWQIEGWSLIDSFFMTVISVTTVGYREVGGELSTPGKLFTVVVIFAGFGVAALALSHFAAALLRGELNNVLGRIRMKKQIEQMKNHFIIGGYGRTGRVIASSFKIKKVPFVVVDSDEKSLSTLTSENIPFILGDASDEDTLKMAGIERAKGFVAVVSSDASNAFAIMTARELNPHLSIIARALDSQSVRKLKIAGADRVIAPYVLGGARIAQAVTNPHASDFIDVVENVESADIEMADLHVDPASPFLGRPVGDPIFKSFDVIVVGIRRKGGSFVFHPKAHHFLEENDHLILMGPTQSVEEFYKLNNKDR